MNASYQDLASLLRTRLEQRPYATLATLACIGYVLGSGLPPVLVRRLVGIGGRITVEKVLAGMVMPR